MSEPKDPAIKLFGKTIPLPENTLCASSCAPSSVASVDDTINQNYPSSATSFPEDDDDDDDAVNDFGKTRVEENEQVVIERESADEGILEEKPTEAKQEEKSPLVTSEEPPNPDATSRISNNSNAPSSEKDSSTLKTSKTEEDQTETSTSQEKTVKKPDKILPCPRCSSMDTKFCYYNNYNVNQPRHFCKNCQRYWTAGGTMRNVPVGAGRRKNKNSATHYRHITVSEALQNARTDLPNGVHHPSLKANGTVLTFGSDTPLCESMASVLNLADKAMRNCTLNGFHKSEELNIPVSYRPGGKINVHSNGASTPPSNSKNGAGKAVAQDSAMHNSQGFPPQIPCFPGAPWPYPWNAAQWSSPVPAPVFCPPGFPMPFYPAAPYWGCPVPGTTWNVPWLPQPSSPKPTVSSSGPNSPTLGKHSRDENMVKADNTEEEEPLRETNTEKCLWIPKTLRIDDPEEAAKSSIWTTLGIKNDKTESVGGAGLFKAFQSKGDEKNHVTEPSPVLQANPAALSRSLNFQESS